MRTRTTPATLPKTNRIQIQDALARRVLLKKLAEAKESVFQASSQASEINERHLRLAINEAEAIAWETGLPHLLFPTLAEEKIRALYTWKDRQEDLWRSEPVVALAE